MKVDLIREMTPDGRKELLEETRKELFEMRTKQQQGYNVHEMKQTRKDIAQIKTVMRELGEI